MLWQAEIARPSTALCLMSPVWAGIHTNFMCSDLLCAVMRENLKGLTMFKCAGWSLLKQQRADKKSLMLKTGDILQPCGFQLAQTLLYWFSSSAYEMLYRYQRGSELTADKPERHISLPQCVTEPSLYAMRLPSGRVVEVQSVVAKVILLNTSVGSDPSFCI